MRRFAFGAGIGLLAVAYAIGVLIFSAWIGAVGG